MASTPNWASSPICGIAQISTANTGRDGTGTIGTVYTAGSAGGRVEAITIIATGTTTDGMVRLFIHDGTNARLWMEVPVRATTPSATAQAFFQYINLADYPFYPLLLQSGYSLRASTEKAETFNVFAHGGNG